MLYRKLCRSTGKVFEREQGQTSKDIMEEVKVRIDESKHGSFYVQDEQEQLGEMLFRISGNDLTVLHTEVSEKAEGKGFAKQLFTSMVDYARDHQMKVIPVCSYVQAQFERNGQAYADVLKRDR